MAFVIGYLHAKMIRECCVTSPLPVASLYMHQVTTSKNIATNTARMFQR